MVDKAIRLRLPNEPGQLATVARHLGEAKVNIRSVAAVGGDEIGSVELLVDDADAARRALHAADVTFSEVEVALVWLADEPGALARAAERLAAEGVNIDSVYIVQSEGGRTRVAFGGAQAEKADQLLTAVAET